MKPSLCFTIGLLAGGGAIGCSDSSAEQTTSTANVVACPCAAESTLSGTVDGRMLTAVATGLMEPDIGALSITLYESGSQPVCYDSGRVEVPDGGGVTLEIALCIPPMGERDVGNLGGPVGTRCTERPDTASVFIRDPDNPDDQGELMDQGTVDITSADGACVSGNIDVTNVAVTGGSTVMQTLTGTFTVPNASCWSAWTDSVTKYCP